LLLLSKIFYLWKKKGMNFTNQRVNNSRVKDFTKIDLKYSIALLQKYIQFGLTKVSVWSLTVYFQLNQLLRLEINS